jgi:tetraacyldisaccharide 4'-kinase
VLRRALYRAGWLRTTHFPVPVVVVGNVTVGGTGKTPLVRALALALRANGRHPGIVSRGHGGRVSGVRLVAPGDDAALVGDEPLLLAADAPVAVGVDRVAAARALLGEHPEVDVIVSDDGLQHYALGRNAEVVVIDAQRRFGNGCLLPAGPLREPAARALRADARVYAGPSNDAALADGDSVMRLEPLSWRPLVEGVAVPDLAALPPHSVHAVAGIAHPQRFFDTLAGLGIRAVTHAFADHHAFTRADLAFPEARAILMTEKDAVKCRRIADEGMFWLPVRAVIDPALVARIEDRIHGPKAA